MHPGMIGGIIGAVVGIIGGLIGTWCGIRNTKGPKERAFMVKFSVVTWIAVSAFLVLLLTLPNPYRHLMWIPYGILLPVGIMYTNKRQAQLRVEEQEGQGPE